MFIDYEERFGETKILEDMNEKIEALKQWVNAYYLQYCTGWTSQRSYGNYDDCFSDGYTVGQSYAAYNVGKILDMKLEDPDEKEKYYEGF